MTYDFFLSGRYRNKENILSLAQRIREKGKTVYCFVESSVSLELVGSIEGSGEEAAANFENLPNWREHPTVQKIFDVDMEGLKSAENFVLILPAGKSAHIEAGVAYGLGKKCIVIGEQKESESLYLIFQEHYSTVEEFLASLS